MQTTIKKPNTNELKQVKNAIDHLSCYETASDKLYALKVLVDIDNLPKTIAGKIINYLNL